LIVNKPAGLVVHPTYKHNGDTMWDAILAYLAEQGGDDWRPPDLPDEPGWEYAPAEIRQMLREKRLAKLHAEEGLLERPTLLHRLDKDTSGVIALARTARACRHVIHQFSSHTIAKTYLAVVQRAAPAWTEPRAPFTVTLCSPTGEAKMLPLSFDLANYEQRTLLLDGPLQRDPDERRRCIVGPDGQSSMTQIKLLACQNDLFLLEAQPITGRTHQIRAHLAAAGYSLVGDPVYAPDPTPGTPTATLTRQFLHAFSLSFNEYPTNVRRTFVAPLPPDLSNWLSHYFPGVQIPLKRAK
jgi:23S rRNA-/tRNA-specific pseudouridylate synthase